MDLLDLYRGRLSLRKVRVLLQHLPPESATMTALRNARPDDAPAGEAGRDPAEGRWSQMEVLLAALVDEVRLARWEAVVARLRKGDKKPKPPQPIPRPGVAPRGKRRKKPLPPEVAEWLLRMQNGGGGGAPPGVVRPVEGVLRGVQ